MRAPPPNDKKLYGGTDALFWKRSGSNLDACGKILSSICVMLVDNITWVKEVVTLYSIIYVFKWFG